MSNPGVPGTPDKEGLASADKWDAKMLEAAPGAPSSAQPGMPPPIPATPPPQGTNAAPSLQEEAPKEPSLLSKIATGAKNLVMHPIDTLMGAGAGAARIPGTVEGGLMDAAGDVAGRQNLKNWGTNLASQPELFPGQHMIGALSMLSGMDLKGTSWQNIASSKDYLGKVGNTSVNQGVATIGSLVLGAEAFGEAKLFGFVSKVAGEGAVGKIATTALNFGASAGVLMDPNEVRFTSALNNLGIHSEFTDWLGADAKDAGPLENRFKNAVENTLGGVAADTIFQGAKYLRSVIKGAPDAAAKEAAVAAAKATIPEAAHPATSDVQAVRGAGHMEVRVDGEPVVQVPSGTFNSLADDTERAFTATPGSIAMEHEAEVSSIEAQAAHAADPANKATAPLPGMDNEAVAPLLRSLAIKLHDTPHVVRTDAERNAMATAAANEVGVDPTDMLAYASHVAGNVADIDVATTATQMLWRNMATQLDAMAQKGITEAAPQAEIEAHKSAINNVVAFSGSFQNIRSSLGRGLRSTSVLRKAADYVGEKLGAGDDVTSKFFKEAGHPVPPQPSSVQDINDFYSVWNDLKGDPAARQNFLRGTQTLPSQWLYLRTSFANNFTANALAGVPSVAMNVAGPGMLGLLHTLEKTTGGFIGALNPLLSKEARAAALSVATNSSRAYIQTVGDVPDAFRFAIQAVKENRSILGGGWTVDVGRMGPVTDAMIRAAKMQDGPTLGYQLGNLINWWPRSFQRINSGLDEFAKRLSYMGEVRLNAMVEHDTTPGLAMSKADYVKSAMENSIDEVGDATNETALRSAERTTLTGQLGTGPGTVQGLVSKGAQFVQSMRSQFPETRYILPVFNVPANALGENLRRIPGLNLLLAETRDELLGHLGAVRQADAYGRTMLAAGFMLWAFHQSRQGQMTGAGPTDPGNRKAWSDQGYMPYSFRFGDKWVDYSRYDLPGAMLALPATMYDSTVYHRQDDPGYEARMLGGIGSLAQYFKDKAALQGASNLMNFGASPGADESFFHRTMNAVVSKSLVPNFVTQLGRNTTDDLKRSATSPSEALMNSLPMASKELDPMRNVLGEPLHVPRDSIAENILPITIAPATTFKSDPVMSELDRFRQATGSAPGVTHPSTFDNNFFDSTQVKLEGGRSLYDALIAARQTTVDPSTGLNLRAALTKLFNDPRYKSAKDADASNLMDSEGNVSRGAVISKVFDSYNKASIQAVAKESPIAKHMLAIVAAKKIDDDKLRPYSAPDLAGNPELLKSLNIDISKYEKKVSGQ